MKPTRLVSKTKTCKVCNKNKIITDFPKRGRYYLKSCDTCYKEEYNRKAREKLLDPEAKKRKTFQGRQSQWKSRYGVTPYQISEALKDQDYKCANSTCRTPIDIDNDEFTTKAVIDHDHSTGRFRAMLCKRCNLILGYLEKRENTMQGLIQYLERFNFN